MTYSVLSLDPSTNGRKWNYSDPTKTDFATEIQGTVVEVNEVQSVNFGTKQPEFWPDGNPKLNIELVIQTYDGNELAWVFSPRSVGMDAVKEAMQMSMPEARSVADVGGKMVYIATQQPPAGFSYGSGNPRPWTFVIQGQGSAPFRGVKTWAEQNKAKPQQQPQPQQQQPQPQPRPPIMQQQPQPRPQMPQMPQGMPANVRAAVSQAAASAPQQQAQQYQQPQAQPAPQYVPEYDQVPYGDM